MKKHLILLFAILFLGGSRTAIGQGPQTISGDGIDFTLKECRYAGGLVTCYLTVVSHGRDRHVAPAFSMTGPVFTLTDNLANTHTLRDARIANADRFDANLISDLPTPLTVSSEFSPSAESIDSLAMKIESEGIDISYLFRNVPVLRDGPQSNDNKPIAVYNGVTFTFDSCRRTGNQLSCTFSVVSTGKDSSVEDGHCIGCRDPQGFVDNLANQYGIDQLVYGNNSPTKTLLANTSTPLKIVTSAFSPAATSVAMLEFRFQDKFISFRNLTVDSGKPRSAAERNMVPDKTVPITHPDAALMNRIRDALDHNGWRRVIVEAPEDYIFIRGEVLTDDMPKILALVVSLKPPKLRAELSSCRTVKGACVVRRTLQ